MVYATSPNAFRRSSHIGKYELLAHIATGGMGVVYRARDPESRREVALKILSPRRLDNPALVERFRREALHASQLCHENIVAAYDFGEDNGTFFLVLELIDGIDLYDRIVRQGPLGPAEAHEYMVQGCRALEHIHARGLVHRDVKPANFLLTCKQGRPVVKLADMGLARDISDEEARLTRCGATVGTLDFMAPEQTRDSGQADIRSDLYSLGATWYFLLTGEPPFPEGELGARLYQILRVPPPDVRDRNPAVPEWTATLLRRLMAKDPAERPQTPAELLAELAVDPPASCPPAAPPSVSMSEKPANRSRPPRPDAPPSWTTAPHAGVGDSGAAAGIFERAREVLRAGNHEYACQLLRNCCRLEPGNIAYRQALRRALKGQVRGNEGGWLRCLGVWAARARLLLASRTGLHQRVLDYGEDVLAREPQDVGARLEMATAAGCLGMTTLAQWLLEDAWRLEPQNVPVQRALAQLHEKEGDVQRAVALWEAVARLDPSDPEASLRANKLATAAAVAEALSAHETRRRPNREC